MQWFEAISENFMNSEGRPLTMLEFIRQDYPIGLHGVSMSIGSVDGVDSNYLKSLKTLIKRVEPLLVSDHLCFTRAGNISLHDLLPLPFTRESLKVVASNINQVQDVLGRQLCIENVSSYFTYKSSEIEEWQFLKELVSETDCGLLLDINNIYVNACNHKFSAEEYISAIQPEAVKQMHLAGFSDMGDFLFDTHSKPVYPKVWELFEIAASRFKNANVIIEWDEDIPEFSILEDEMVQAREIHMKVHSETEESISLS